MCLIMPFSFPLVIIIIHGTILKYTLLYMGFLGKKIILLDVMRNKDHQSSWKVPNMLIYQLYNFYNNDVSKSDKTKHIMILRNFRYCKTTVIVTIVVVALGPHVFRTMFLLPTGNTLFYLRP